MKDTSVKDIFISYRRKGGDTMAHLLHRQLVTDGYTVFLDVKESKYDRFDKELYKRIEDCTDFLLIVSAGCFDGCEDPRDWVRQEVEHALQCGKHIVPVILRDCEIPEDLPDSMQKIAVCRGIRVYLDMGDSVFENLERELIHSKPRVSVADLDVVELDSPKHQAHEEDGSLHERMSQQALQDTMNRADDHITAIRATQGDVEAQFRLWEIYHNYNKSTAAAEKQMIYWLKLAVAQNHPKAMCCLGKCYYYGYGVKRHPAKAVIFFRKSLEYDNSLTEAMLSLGDCYLNGVGVESNILQAANMYKQAMEAGDSVAAGKYLDLIRTADAAKELNIIRVVKKIESMIEKKDKRIDYPKVFRLLAIRVMGAMKYGMFFGFRLMTDRVDTAHTMDQLDKAYLQKYKHSSAYIIDIGQAILAGIMLFCTIFLILAAFFRDGVFELPKYNIQGLFSSQDTVEHIRLLLLLGVQLAANFVSLLPSLLITITIVFIIMGIADQLRDSATEYTNIKKKIVEYLVKCVIILLVWCFIDPIAAIVILFFIHFVQWRKIIDNQ